MIDTNVFKLAQPGTFTDSLTEILRSGARALLTQAVEAEVADFLHRHCDLKTDTGRRRVAPPRAGGPRARGAPRASARARDHDGHWSGWRAPAADTRPRGGCG